MVRIEVKDDIAVNEYLDNIPYIFESEIDKDCCEIAKDVFKDSITTMLNTIATARQIEILPNLLTIHHLSCEHFLEFLEKLHKVTQGWKNIGGQVRIAYIIGQYIRLNNVPTSMLGTVTNVISEAGRMAIEAWERCNKAGQTANRMYNARPLQTQDKGWQSMLERSEDNKFNTWDNILLTAYKPLNNIQKMTCPKCKKGEMKMITYHKGKRGMRRTGDKAILECDKCGHREVFE